VWSRRTRAAPRTRRRRAHELLAAADTICCCTTASEPLFDGHVVADHTTVVAIGSHEPDARDVHDALVGRATVVVESSSSARREAPASLLLAEIGPWPCQVNAIPRCTFPVTGYRFRVKAAPRALPTRLLLGAKSGSGERLMPSTAKSRGDHWSTACVGTL
jgi:hypothetical protein